MDKLVTEQAGREPSKTCSCATPIPEVRAIWKGAARTHCSRCNSPIQLEFEVR